MSVEEFADIMDTLQALYAELDERDNRGEYDAEHMNKVLREVIWQQKRLCLHLFVTADS